MFDSVNFIACY